jgi:hypothetical protein
LSFVFVAQVQYLLYLGVCHQPLVTNLLATEMGGLQERITSTTDGSITSIQAVYVPADDLTDPAPATTFTDYDSSFKKLSWNLSCSRPIRFDINNVTAVDCR